MSKVFCVSYPRSGSTWLKSAMHHAMQNNFSYCDSHQTPPDPSQHNWIKSHDFNLDVNPPNGFAVIFLCRDPFDAVPSWWNLNVREGKAQRDDYDNWATWAPRAFCFWKRLREKWVQKADMIIWMPDLQLAPQKFLRQIGEVMTEDFRVPELILPEFNQPTSGYDFKHYRLSDFKDFLKLTR